MSTIATEVKPSTLETLVSALIVKAAQGHIRSTHYGIPDGMPEALPALYVHALKPGGDYSPSGVLRGQVQLYLLSDEDAPLSINAQALTTSTRFVHRALSELIEGDVRKLECGPVGVSTGDGLRIEAQTLHVMRATPAVPMLSTNTVPSHVLPGIAADICTDAARITRRFTTTARVQHGIPTLSDPVPSGEGLYERAVTIPLTVLPSPGVSLWSATQRAMSTVGQSKMRAVDFIGRCISASCIVTSESDTATHMDARLVYQFAKATK